MSLTALQGRHWAIFRQSWPTILRTRDRNVDKACIVHATLSRQCAVRVSDKVLSLDWAIPKLLGSDAGEDH